MKSPEEIENVLENLGRAWPGDGSITERVMRQIESAPPVAARPKRRRILMKSLLAIAASFLAFLAVWWAVEGSRGSLYAQVVDGVRKAQTIHITDYEQRERSRARQGFRILVQERRGISPGQLGLERRRRPATHDLPR